MTREEAKQLAVLQAQVEAFLMREDARSQKIDEIYDMLRFMRGLWRFFRWVGGVALALYIAVKHGDWEGLREVFK